MNRNKAKCKQDMDEMITGNKPGSRGMGLSGKYKWRWFWKLIQAFKKPSLQEA